MRGKATLRMQLGEVAKAKPAVAIGSYPFFDPRHGPNTNVVPRAAAHKIAQAKRAVERCWSECRGHNQAGSSLSHGENSGRVP